MPAYERIIKNLTETLKFAYPKVSIYLFGSRPVKLGKEIVYNNWKSIIYRNKIKVQLI